MGVESGPSGGGIGVSVGPAKSFGPSSFGVKLEASSASFIAEGRPSFSLKDTMPYTFNDLNIIRGGNRFNLGVELNSPETEVPAVFQSGLSDINLDPSIQVPVPKLDVFDSLASEVATVEPAISSLPGIKPVIEFIAPQVDPKIAPWIDTGIFSKPEIKTENTLAIQPAIQTQFENRTTTQEQLVEEVVEEVALNQPQTIEAHTQEEKFDRAAALHVIDRKALVNRVTRILTRVLAVITELTVKKDPKEKSKPQKIKGSDMTVGLPASNQQEIRGGEINRKDPEGKLPDKTWDATIEQLRRLDFDSVEQIETQVPAVVLDNHPVIVANQGEVASDKNVVKSHQNDKESHAYLEFEKRKQRYLP